MSIEIPINVNMEVEESQMAFNMEVDEEIDVTVIQGTDVSDTTAVEADVLTGKKFHKADGSLATGTFSIPVPTNMISNGDFSQAGATTDGWAAYSPYQSSIAVADGKLILTHTVTNNRLYGVKCAVNTQADHIYYVRYKIKKTESDSDSDAKILRFILGADYSGQEATRVLNIDQNNIIENVFAIKATANSSNLVIIFGGNISTEASNNPMLELYYIEMYDITDIVAVW